MEKDLEFLKLEYENLRHEIETISKELRDTERYAIVIVATIWAWLATKYQDVSSDAILYLWWLPVFVVTLGMIRFIGVHLSLNRIANYIADYVEPKFLANENGWQNHLKKSTMITKYNWWISSYLIWAVLLIISVLIACQLGPEIGSNSKCDNFLGIES